MSRRRCINCGHIYDTDKSIRLPNGRIAPYGTCPDCLNDKELPGNGYREEYNSSAEGFVIKTPLTQLQQYDEFGEPLPLPEPMKFPTNEEIEDAQRIIDSMDGLHTSEPLTSARMVMLDLGEHTHGRTDEEIREAFESYDPTWDPDSEEELQELQNLDHDAPSQGEQDVIQNDDTTSSPTSLDDYI